MHKETNIRLPIADWERLKAIAVREHRSVTNLIHLWVIQKLNEEEGRDERE
jgi:hypothetical protein